MSGRPGLSRGGNANFGESGRGGFPSSGAASSGYHTPSDSRRDTSDARRDSPDSRKSSHSARSNKNDPGLWVKFALPLTKCVKAVTIEIQRCYGRVVLPCYPASTELEANRLKFALTGAPSTGARRASFAFAAADADKAFKSADIDGDEVLSTAEVMRLEGMPELAKFARTGRLLTAFDDHFAENQGIDLLHFKEMHYRMNKTCQALMREGDTDAAKGELLMLYSVVEMLEEKVIKLQRELASKEAMEEACNKTLKNMEEIERAVHGTRQLMKSAQQKMTAQTNQARSNKLRDMM
uniref:Uncharacterized protein n=1 Tax=Haptolina brevifila TaxID=156173 RepID=A0A7S2MJJ1_9EUKA|mmetsp:Transcript_53459/g.106340  ORF Transcript_53459/g.106340 Transcript_53459/m.106340 type:complete len:295 (+) Transcript_53459:121-1005(+)